MKPALIVLFTLASLAGARAQEPGAARPPQDPKAVAMLEKFDSLVYNPRAAGLKDLEFSVKLPVGFHVLVRWKAPDRVRADLVVPADAPAEIKRQLEIQRPRFEPSVRQNARSFAVTQIGEALREKHKDDEIVLVAPNQVKIVPRSEASRSEFKEEVMTFDDQGLVTQVRVTAPTGLESLLEPTFSEPKDGRRVQQSLKTTMGKLEQMVRYEYVAVDGFQLVGKMTTTMKGSPQGTLEFTGFKVNSGLADAVFEEKPAESKPLR